MKRFICIVLATASLGGCIVLPVDNGYGHHRYADAPVLVVPSARPGYGPGYGRGYRGW